MILFKVL